LKTLIIENNENIVNDITFYLQIRYPDSKIIWESDGLKGIKLIETTSPDLVIVGFSNPDLHHLEMVSQIRNFSEVPLLVLSEATTDIDRARDLEIGADSYVTQPFSPADLLAKIKALLRRVQPLGFRLEKLIHISDQISINIDTQEVFLDDNPIKLTPIEFKLLTELVRNNGKILTHDYLLDKVWGSNYFNDHSFVKKYVYRLRSKLGFNNSRRLIVSVRGTGYKLLRQY
jgi:DNA-binding response OmpR family regulator